MKGPLALGTAVEIQRAVGAPWEPATYSGRVADMKGWHFVDLPPTAPEIRINSMSGMETTADDPQGFTHRRPIVPSQRIRVKS